MLSNLTICCFLVNLQVKLNGTPWFRIKCSPSLAYGALGLRVRPFRVNTFFGTPAGTRRINMSKAELTEDNYIPVDEDKLKDDKKAELEKATDDYKKACLKSFSSTRGGEVVKKFNFPTLQTFTEV